MNQQRKTVSIYSTANIVRICHEAVRVSPQPDIIFESDIILSLKRRSIKSRGKVISSFMISI